jgi:hypothetical protein
LPIHECLFSSRKRGVTRDTEFDLAERMPIDFSSGRANRKKAGIQSLQSRIAIGRTNSMPNLSATFQRWTFIPIASTGQKAIGRSISTS